MGVDAADIDSDSDFDLIVTNFSHDHTTLYENLGAGFFTDASYRRGIGKDTYFPLSWGVRFADLDADSDVDLYVAHGHIYPEVDRVAPETTYAEPDQVFRNDGKGFFTLEPFSSSRRSSRGLSAGDYDNDGRIDLLVTNIDGPAELLHNETEPSGAGLLVALVGTKSARDGLGAVVTVETSSGKTAAGSEDFGKPRERPGLAAPFRARERLGRDRRGPVAVGDERSRETSGRRPPRRDQGRNWHREAKRKKRGALTPLWIRREPGLAYGSLSMVIDESSIRQEGARRPDGVDAHPDGMARQRERSCTPGRRR